MISCPAEISRKPSLHQTTALAVEVMPVVVAEVKTREVVISEVVGNAEVLLNGAAEVRLEPAITQAIWVGEAESAVELQLPKTRLYGFIWFSSSRRRPYCQPVFSCFLRSDARKTLMR